MKADGANSNAAHILIAEDSLPQAFALRRVLEEHGYRVTSAANGREALDAARAETPRMIISDIEMPVLNGYEMCLAIKDNPEWRHIPVILLTNLSDPENILQGLKAKADYYLTKPYSPAYLLERVRVLLDDPLLQDGEQSMKPIEIKAFGKSHTVTASRAQMLRLLLSTYENAVQQNRELIQTQYELSQRNQQLREQTRQIREQQQQLQQANVKLQELATSDGLTGLKNHRAFKERLEEEFQRAARYELPLSLLAVDVDRFKQFNDDLGHPAGDRALRQVADILREAVRVTDFVARYGGEEFMVILPNTNAEEAIDLAERLRRAFESAPWPERAVTVSVGAASLRLSTLSSSDLLAEADRALYASKQAGRNRVTHADQLLKARGSGG